MSASMPPFEDVLSVWLGAYPLDAAAMQRVRPQWFQKDDAFDAQLRERFEPTIEAALFGQRDDWAASAEGRLALLIVLDQFTRNVFRGRPESFAGDAQALALALAGIKLGHDQAVPPMARIFCYLPLEHAEDAALQARSVALFEALRDGAADQATRSVFDSTLDFARRHQQVIERFGRFPHRNAVLGRASTPQELRYLAEPGSGF